MSRCICCNRMLNTVELHKKKLDGNPEDMCFVCLGAIVESDYFEYKDRQLVTVTDSLYHVNGFLNTPE